MAQIDEIESQLQSVLETLKQSVGQNSTRKLPAQLIAVSKKQPAAFIRRAYQCGQRHFGENYVQELLEKQEQLTDCPEIVWHLIGPVQSNKLKIAQKISHYFHAFDHAMDLSYLRKCENFDRSESKGPWKIFIQINVDDESSKHGLPIDQAILGLDQVLKIPSLWVQGFMAIPNPTKNVEGAFLKMAQLRDYAEQHLGRALDLSMGMSADYALAASMGSQWVRVGTAIFGARAT